MADSQRVGPADKDIDQAIAALKKGAYLLKYGRRGKPKFCPFQLSNDENLLIWYSGKEEKQLKLSQVSKIIPGQRTAIFQRYPQPEKEYQSFSLIYSDRSLDLICKDKHEAEVWFVGLKALITHGNQRKWRLDSRSGTAPSDSPEPHIRRHSTQSISSSESGQADGQGNQVPVESIPQNRLGKAFCEIVSYTAQAKSPSQAEILAGPYSYLTAACIDNSNNRTSASENTVRVSLSSAVSSSSQGSYHEDFDALGDVFFWGEGTGDGVLVGGFHSIGQPSSSKVDAFLPKVLESKLVLDVNNIACGGKHAVLVTKQGEIFSWGEGSGGKLGHGVEFDVPNPKLIDTLAGINIESVACGEHHACAVTLSGDLYSWGDGVYNSGVLGHGSEASHWIPKKVGGDMDGLHVSFISCGVWHTAAVTSTGRLFTFGDGSFGTLGHGDRESVRIPTEVKALRGLKTKKVACGIWHTAAAVEVATESSSPEASGSCSSVKLFTWGDGDNYRLGHGDKESRLFPKCVAALDDVNVCQVACGHDLTVVLTTAGQVYTMGSTCYGQLGCPKATGKIPAIVEGKISKSFVEEISCGSYHVAALTSKSDVYTWGKGKNGQLGHGDNENRDTPSLVGFLKDKQVKAVACGSNFTAIICPHRWFLNSDHSICSGCHNPFGFRRKRHNCYNCGLVFCKACSSRKSLKAALAPNMNKPHRVCDDCFNKLKKVAEHGLIARSPKSLPVNMNQKSNDAVCKENQCSKLQGHLSRLSSVESISVAESCHSAHDRRSESEISGILPVVKGNWLLGSSSSLKVPVFISGTAKKLSLDPVPSFKTTLQVAPSFAGKLSPARSFDDQKNSNDNFSDQITSLKAQVDDLTAKSRRLETELEKKSRQLKEVAAIAADEAEKRKSAKEVIKSLTTQLKQMAEKLPDRRSSSPISVSSAKLVSISEDQSPSKSNSSEVSHEIESNGNADHQMLPFRAKSQSDKPQPHCVIQTEPGVYITLSSIPGGGNELKRIRFSRKHFTEQQAEKWWTEHGPRICERHNILDPD